MNYSTGLDITSGYNVCHIVTTIFLSVVGYFILVKVLIPGCVNMFINANLKGIDLNKNDPKPIIPEAQGALCGLIYLVILFCLILIIFYNEEQNFFKHNEFAGFLSGLLSICCMIFLGFADDVLNLRWSIKLILPTIASLPLLMVYAVNYNTTTIVVPKPVRIYLGSHVNIGFLYYIYMAMLAVFCTNAINIYAGINGIEASQSLVIAFSVLVLNFVEIVVSNCQSHLYSVYFLIPYIAVCLALVKFNWYPARVFVGDTFCYFSGMTFAVIAILGHFSKTMLLFFIPQIINFLYSVPQLFYFIPCPRHRLPRKDEHRDVLNPSTVQFKLSDLKFLGRVSFYLLKKFHLITYREFKKEDEVFIECNNFTIINLYLITFGPTHEETLTKRLIMAQIVCSCIAFIIRYPLAWVFYDL